MTKKVETVEVRVAGLHNRWNANTEPSIVMSVNVKGMGRHFQAAKHFTACLGRTRLTRDEFRAIISTAPQTILIDLDPHMHCHVNSQTMNDWYERFTQAVATVKDAS